VSPSVDATRGGRHSGRELALQVLYALDLANRSGEATAEDDAPRAPRESSDRVFERVTEHFVMPRAAIAFARSLVTGVAGDLEAIDVILAGHARNWRVSRMAAVDRNVLRLAIHELRDTETPVAVVIDEAVDLARRFGSDTSPAFVNGILDAVAKEVRAA